MVGLSRPLQDESKNRSPGAFLTPRSSLYPHGFVTNFVGYCNNLCTCNMRNICKVYAINCNQAAFFPRKYRRQNFLLR